MAFQSIDRTSSVTGMGTAWLAVAVAVVAVGLVVVLGPFVAIAVTLGLLAVIAAVTMPGLLFAAYLLIPFYKGALQPYFPIDLTVVLALANAVQIVPVLLDRRVWAISRVGVALWIALGALIIGGALYAPSQGLALGVAATFWALVLLPVLAGSLRVGSEPRYIRQLLWTFFAMGVVTIVMGLLQLSSIDRLVILGMNTIQVSLAALLVPLIGVSFVLFEGPRPIRWLVVVLCPLAFVVALASGSRGPVLVLLLLAAVGALRNIASIRAMKRWVVIALAAAAAGTVALLTLASTLLPAMSVARFALLGDFIQATLAGDSGASTGDTSSAARVRLINLAWAMFTDHPILGSGPAGFQALSPLYAGPAGADRYPHNSVLQFAAEFGIVGVIAFMSIVVVALQRRLPPGRAWATVKAMFVFLLLNSLLSGDILEDRMLWGFLLLILVAQAVPSLSEKKAAPTMATARAGPFTPDVGGFRTFT